MKTITSNKSILSIAFTGLCALGSVSAPQIADAAPAQNKQIDGQTATLQGCMWFTQRPVACEEACGLCGLTWSKGKKCIEDSKCIMPDDKGGDKTVTPRPAPTPKPKSCKPNEAPDGKGDCVTMCPIGEKWDGTKCLQRCPDNTFVTAGEACACPLGQEWDFTAKKCKDICTDGKKWNSGICMRFCPNNLGEKWVAESVECDHVCNTSAGEFLRILKDANGNSVPTCMKLCDDVTGENPRGHAVRWDQNCPTYVAEHIGTPSGDSDTEGVDSDCEEKLAACMTAKDECGTNLTTCTNERDKLNGQVTTLTNEQDTARTERDALTPPPGGEESGGDSEGGDDSSGFNVGGGCHCNPYDMDWREWLFWSLLSLLTLGIWRRQNIVNVFVRGRNAWRSRTWFRRNRSGQSTP